MIQTRKRVSSKGTPSAVKRLRSNFDGEGLEEVEEGQKPKSSISQRPQSCRRSKQLEARSITTDSSNKNDIDVEGLIRDVFDKSFDLSKYLSRKNLDPEECRAKLLGNSLFHTLLISRLTSTQEEEYESIVAR